MPGNVILTLMIEVLRRETPLGVPATDPHRLAAVGASHGGEVGKTCLCRLSVVLMRNIGPCRCLEIAFLRIS
jgi:hypothetical protein